MNLSYRTKKAISPLIATVLIIGLTIIIFSFAMIWQQGIIQELIEGPALKSAECARLDFKIHSACKTTNSIIIHLENIESEEIAGFEFRLQGDASTQMAPSPPFKTYRVAEEHSITIPYLNSLIGQLNEVEVIPKIKLKDQSPLCTDQAKTLVNLQDC